MKRLVLFLVLCLPLAAQDISGGGGGASAGDDLTTGCTDGQILYGNSGELDCGTLADISGDLDDVSPDVSTGLVHHWAMEPGTCSGDASTITDAGSALQDFTCGTPPNWSASSPAVGSCYVNFTSASTESCVTTTSPTLPTGDEFTYAMWIQFDSNNYVPWGAKNGTSAEMLMFITSGNDIWINMNDGTTILNSMDITTATWYHFAFVRIGTVGELYINGRRMDKAQITGVALDFSTCAFFLGGSDSTGCDAIDGNWFDGGIDDFRIYSRALNQNEIIALYELGN